MFTRLSQFSHSLYDVNMQFGYFRNSSPKQDVVYKVIAKEFVLRYIVLDAPTLVHKVANVTALWS